MFPVKEKRRKMVQKLDHINNAFPLRIEITIDGLPIYIANFCLTACGCERIRTKHGSRCHTQVLHCQRQMSTLPNSRTQCTNDHHTSVLIMIFGYRKITKPFRIDLLEIVLGSTSCRCRLSALMEIVPNMLLKFYISLCSWHMYIPPTD